MFGLDISVVQKRVLLAAMILGIIAITVFCLWVRSCLTKPAKLDIKNIEKINKANETDRKAELQTEIERNAGVVKTVDGRNSIAEVNETEKQAQINAKIEEVSDKVAQAKASGHDVTSDELECMLVPENCK